MNGTNFEPQDITTWDKDLKDIDLILHGSPCQDFSLAGKQAGADEGSGTRSSLMYETIRIVEKLKPKYVIWENVRNVLSKKHIHNFNNYINKLDELGYTSYYQVLNAKDYGIPQNRERVFTISVRKDINKVFTFPQSIELKLKLKDILEDNVDEKYYLSDEIVNKIKFSNFNQKKKRIQEKDYCDTILARDYKDPKCVNVGYVESKYNKFIDKKGYIPNMFNPYNESEIKDIAPTQSTQCGSTTSSATVLIKNATKKGYMEAHDGDSVNLAYPTSNTRRGRVGKQVSQTITTADNIGVVIKED